MNIEAKDFTLRNTDINSPHEFIEIILREVKEWAGPYQQSDSTDIGVSLAGKADGVLQVSTLSSSSAEKTTIKKLLEGYFPSSIGVRIGWLVFDKPESDVAEGDFDSAVNSATPQKRGETKKLPTHIKESMKKGNTRKATKKNTRKQQLKEEEDDGSEQVSEDIKQKIKDEVKKEMKEEEEDTKRRLKSEMEDEDSKSQFGDYMVCINIGLFYRLDLHLYDSNMMKTKRMIQLFILVPARFP